MAVTYVEIRYRRTLVLTGILERMYNGKRCDVKLIVAPYTTRNISVKRVFYSGLHELAGKQIIAEKEYAPC